MKRGLPSLSVISQLATNNILLVQEIKKLRTEAKDETIAKKKKEIEDRVCGLQTTLLTRGVKAHNDNVIARGEGKILFYII